MTRMFRAGRSARARAHNLRLLESGDLFVARFSGGGDADSVHDGTGTWLPLVVDGDSQVPGMSAIEVLVFTRQAGDRVGATKTDRPEDVEVTPSTVACT